MTLIVEADLLEDLRSELLERLRAEGYRELPDGDAWAVARAWAGARRRFIPRKARRAMRSAELRLRTLPADIAAGLSRFIGAIEDGRNLNPHRSRRWLDVDESDHLFDMWAIHHFHLSPSSGARMAPATNELLFAVVTDAEVRMLDILDHTSKPFAAARLGEILNRNWPSEAMGAIVSVTPQSPEAEPPSQEAKPLSDEDRKRMWRLGVTTIEKIDGVLIVPTGGGKTSDGGSSLDTTTADTLLDVVSAWQHRTAEPAFVARVAAAASRGRAGAPETLGVRLHFQGNEMRLVEGSTGTRLDTFTIR